MVRIIAKSEFGAAIDAGYLEQALPEMESIYGDLFGALGWAMDSGLAPVSLTASEIRLSGNAYGSIDFEIVASGSGISPVSSIDELDDALTDGMATGTFNKISFKATKDAGYPGDSAYDDEEFLTVDIAKSGYTLTSGAQVISITGSVITSLEELSGVAELAEGLSEYDSLSASERSFLLSKLADYGITGFSIASEGVEILAFDATTTAISISVLGYKYQLNGSFPTDFGGAVPMLMEVTDFVGNGGRLKFNDIAGFSVNNIRVFNPDGEVILKSKGKLGNTDTIGDAILKFDGTLIKNLMVGENGSNELGYGYVPNDFLTGAGGKDHIFGLAGHDSLAGGAGNDFLYGGSGNDVLHGGAGNDLLNPGDNLSYDQIISSAGDDTMVFSDMLTGYVDLTYSAESKGITAFIDGNAGTGTVVKKSGTDTLVDVDVPMQAAYMPQGIGGFGLIGTQFADSFTATVAKNGWMSVFGGAGTDSFDLTIESGSILRLSFDSGFLGGTDGADVDVAGGIINNDGYDNYERLSVTSNGGLLELQGTIYNDRLVGSNIDERFILLSGDDYADGAGGVDLVRYDRSGVEYVDAHLGKNKATGIWNGVEFTHKIKNMEDLRGSRDGDDKLIGNGKANEIRGRGGDDKLIGKGGKDDLRGEAGDDLLNGGGGRDRLTGGSGDDVLMGKKGNDTFVFNGSANEGRDTIRDFKNNKDMLEISDTSFAELSIKKSGGGSDTLISLESGTEILLEGVSKSQIDAGDFDFV
ncbi:calcium-binding protein [Neptunicoccus sediminis]|uniref:calcium-binding protein n=1 Tax=Neptunicoccus sediminis TaxID=1892596 RepID=UPI000845D6F5|nr:calcium-binding protein [Neptunicoccus sediminis]